MPAGGPVLQLPPVVMLSGDGRPGPPRRAMAEELLTIRAGRRRLAHAGRQFAAAARCQAGVNCIRSIAGGRRGLGRTGGGRRRPGPGGCARWVRSLGALPGEEPLSSSDLTPPLGVAAQQRATGEEASTASRAQIRSVLNVVGLFVVR